MEKHIQAEKSIVKKFSKEIWSRFTHAVKEFQMVKNGDKIAVCVSGGKDSFLLAKCMQELKKHKVADFEIVFIIMNPGYSEENKQIILNNAKLLNIPAHMFETDIYNAVAAMGGSPCYMCARMRRGHLYSKAKELGCNKIALGHHFDDVIETILMSMLYGAEIKTMMPKLKSTNFKGMELIRPLYRVREEHIKAWKDYNKLSFINCACRFTELCSTESSDLGSSSKRKEVKQLLAQLRKGNSYIDNNIFKSVYNVNLSTIIGYKKGEKQHSFLDEYNS